MFKINAINYRVDTSLTIKNSNTLPFQNRRLRGIKKANKANLKIKEELNFESFWKNVLIPNLFEKYNTKPTHNLEEISCLAIKFPNNIKQFNIYHNNEIVAGCTVFETQTTAHAQYISTNDLGKKMGALDKLFQYLILEKYKDKDFFDTLQHILSIVFVFEQQKNVS